MTSGDLTARLSELASRRAREGVDSPRIEPRAPSDRMRAGISAWLRGERPAAGGPVSPRRADSLLDVRSAKAIEIGGELPVNPDGGGLSNNHPGMRGIFLVIEAVKQLRSECGARQVEGAKLACAHGTGGTLGISHSGATIILGTD